MVSRDSQVATWATVGIDIYMSIVDMATWAAICTTTNHIIPLNSDGPYGRTHVAHSRGSVATQATILSHDYHVATWE